MQLVEIRETSPKKFSSLLWGARALSLLLFALGIANVFFASLPLAIGLLMVGGGAATAILWGYTKLAPLLEIEEEKERELERLRESVEDGIISYNTDFAITSINEAACRMVNASKDRVTGRAITPEAVNSRTLARLAQIIFPSLAPNAVTTSPADIWPQTTEIVLEDPYEELRATTHRITDREGRVRGFIKIIHNKTRESAMVKSKSDFITIAAHQLRTPLTAIGWSLENVIASLEDKDVQPEAAQQLKEARELADRTLKITNDLLDTARIEEGKFGYALEKTDMRSLLEEVTRTARAAAELRSVSLALNLPREPLTVNADPAKLSTALLNVIDNAIRYNVPNGEVAISAQAERGKVLITVRDSGIGIPQNDLAKIFEKMHRGSNAAAQEPNGSGLGLFITKNIIEGHQGTIRIESVEKRGTRVFITIPLVS